MEWPSTPPSPSMKQKISSISFFSCCFRGSESEEERPAVAASLIRSSSSWIRSKASELPELTERYRGMMMRMGKSTRRGYGEFRYDPLSYALNFDEGVDDAAVDADEFRYRNFSSRLPATPPQPSTGFSCR